MECYCCSGVGVGGDSVGGVGVGVSAGVCVGGVGFSGVGEIGGIGGVVAVNGAACGGSGDACVCGDVSVSGFSNSFCVGADVGVSVVGVGVGSVVVAVVVAVAVVGGAISGRGGRVLWRARSLPQTRRPQFDLLLFVL